MSENKKIYKKVKAQTPFMTVLKLYISGIIAFIFILSMFALIVMNIYTPQNMMRIYVIADAAVVSFIISVICCRVIQHKKLIFGMTLSLLTVISEFILILCFNSADITPETYLMFPVVLIISLIGCITGSNMRIRNNRRRH